MPSRLLLPANPGLQVWRKPPPDARLDYSHPLAKNLVQAFPFTEWGSKTLRDRVNPQQSISLSAVTWVNSPYGPALSFNGTTSVATLSQAFTPSGSAWSVEMLASAISLPASNGFGALLVVGQTDGLYLANNTGVVVGWDIDSTTQDVMVGSAPTVGTWYHLVFSYDGTTANVWQDAVNVANGAMTAANFTYGWASLGNESPAASSFNGKIAWLRIWDGRALSQREVTLLHNNPHAMYTSPVERLRTLLMFGGATSTGPTNKSISDSATGSDSVALATLSFSIPADTALGAEAIVIGLPIGPDTATGSESISLAAVSVGVSDSATGSDSSVTATVTAPISDSATGSEAVSLATVTLPIPADTAVGSEGLSVTVTAPLSESAIGTDQVALSPVTITVTDTATGSEVTTATVSFTISDSATGSEQISGLGGGTPVTLSDSSTAASETLSLATIAVSISESATGSETVALGPLSPTLTESGIGADTLTIGTVSIPLNDAAAGTESLTVLVTLAPGAETASGTDLLSFASPSLITLVDNATGLEVLSTLVTPHLPGEVSTGAEGIGVTQPGSVILQPRTELAFGVNGKAIAYLVNGQGNAYSDSTSALALP